MDDQILALANKAMAEAGRGKIISYRNIPENLPETVCEYCKRSINRAGAYHQEEWAAWGGRRVRVTAYYCDKCRGRLESIGQGEITDLEHRAAERPGAEPHTKQDF